MKKTILVLLLVGVVIGGGFLTFSSQKETETTSTVEQIKESPKPIIYDVIFDGENWNVVNRRKVQTGKKFSKEEVGTVADFGTFATLLVDNGSYHIYFN